MNSGSPGGICKLPLLCEKNVGPAAIGGKTPLSPLPTPLARTPQHPRLQIHHCVRLKCCLAYRVNLLSFAAGTHDYCRNTLRSLLFYASIIFFRLA